MGTVDIRELVDIVIQSDLLDWDGETPSFKEMYELLKETITKVVEYHYSLNDGEIEDWNIFERDVYDVCNHQIAKWRLQNGMK